MLMIDLHHYTLELYKSAKGKTFGNFIYRFIYVKNGGPYPLLHELILNFMDSDKVLRIHMWVYYSFLCLYSSVTKLTSTLFLRFSIVLTKRID